MQEKGEKLLQVLTKKHIVCHFSRLGTEKHWFVCTNGGNRFIEAFKDTETVSYHA